MLDRASQGQELRALASPESDPRKGCLHLEPERLVLLGLEPELPALPQMDHSPEQVLAIPVQGSPVLEWLALDHQKDCQHSEPERPVSLGLEPELPELLQTDRSPEQDLVSSEQVVRPDQAWQGQVLLVPDRRTGCRHSVPE